MIRAVLFGNNWFRLPQVLPQGRPRGELAVVQNRSDIIATLQRWRRLPVNLAVRRSNFALEPVRFSAMVAHGATLCRFCPVRHRPVQNRGHQPDRPVEIDVRGRVGIREIGRLTAASLSRRLVP